MGSFFVEQGTQMDRQMFGGKLRIPAASLALFNTISIIALIPVYDRVLVPGLRYFNKQITLLQRIGGLRRFVKRTVLVLLRAGNVLHCFAAGAFVG